MSDLNSVEELFRGRHFDREVIVLCVRRYSHPILLYCNRLYQHASFLYNSACQEWACRNCAELPGL